jgi:hypothetical protein
MKRAGKGKAGAPPSGADLLLRDPQVKTFLKTHQGCEDRVRRAAESLLGKEDGLAALRKVLPALGTGTINVFLSYKRKRDQETAEAIVKTLRKYSANRLRITYQGEFTKEIAGREYEEWIAHNVREAHWFVLLLPEGRKNFEWCMYETGQFKAVRTSSDRMICVHRPKAELPDAIKDLHSVELSERDMEDFLRMVYLEPDPIPGMEPVNPALSESISLIADEILHAITPHKLHRRVFEPWIELQINNADRLEKVSELDPARVLSASESAMELFEFIRQPRTFGELRSGLAEKDGDDRWRQELLHVVRKIAQGRSFDPIQAVVHIKARLQRGKIYRPVLCAIDRIGAEGPIHSYDLAFIEEVSPIDDMGIPPDIATIAAVLRFAFRFKWEVIEPFSPNVLSEDDLGRLTNCLQRIRRDWESRGVGGQTEILGVFRDTQQRDRVAQMLATWAKLQNRAGSGELDAAIRARDTKMVHEKLEPLVPMVEEFLKLATDRFVELITRK